MSYAALGRETRTNDPDAARMATGFSVYVSFSYARRVAKRFPWKGNCFIAEIDLPDRDDVVLEQTGSKPEHYTLWCDVELIRASLVRVVHASEVIDDV
jgi:hypothetical protein